MEAHVSKKINDNFNQNSMDRIIESINKKTNIIIDIYHKNNVCLSIVYSFFFWFVCLQLISDDDDDDWQQSFSAVHFLFLINQSQSLVILFDLEFVSIFPVYHHCRWIMLMMMAIDDLVHVPIQLYRQLDYVQIFFYVVSIIDL